MLTARPIERIEVSPAPMMDDFLPPRCDLGTVGADAHVFVCTCIKCFKSVDTRCELCSKDAYRKQVDVFCNACLRADASIGASLESCAACSALSAADVQRAAAAGGAASVATPPSPPASIAHVDDADELQRYAQLAEEQNGSLLKGTVHCELLDYLLTIALQRNQGLSREDIVDLALGYLEVALPRPIPAARVEDHVNAVFPLLRKYAAARASGRDVAAGEQFDPAVHKWDADATYSDWARMYEAAYTVAPLQRRRAVLQASPRLRARQQTLFNRAPPCAATGAKRKAADHRCIECGNASVDAAGANLC